MIDKDYELNLILVQGMNERDTADHPAILQGNKIQDLREESFTQLTDFGIQWGKALRSRRGWKIEVHLQEKGKIIGFASTDFKRLSEFVCFDNALVHNYIINTGVRPLLQYWSILNMMNV